MKRVHLGGATEELTEHSNNVPRYRAPIRASRPTTLAGITVSNLQCFGAGNVFRGIHRISNTSNRQVGGHQPPLNGCGSSSWLHDPRRDLPVGLLRHRVGHPQAARPPPGSEPQQVAVLSSTNDATSWTASPTWCAREVPGGSGPWTCHRERPSARRPGDMTQANARTVASATSSSTRRAAVEGARYLRVGPRSRRWAQRDRGTRRALPERPSHLGRRRICRKARRLGEGELRRRSRDREQDRGPARLHGAGAPVVERTFSWIAECRRLTYGYERSIAHSEARVQ